MQDDNKKLIDAVRKIIQIELQNLGLLHGHWHLGKVASVISSTKITAYVDGSSVAQTISANPDVTFAVNDEIWVIFVNGRSVDKFAIAKRAI